VTVAPALIGKFGATGAPPVALSVGGTCFLTILAHVVPAQVCDGQIRSTYVGALLLVSTSADREAIRLSDDQVVLNMLLADDPWQRQLAHLNACNWSTVR
jgi:hypothetical protein